jgi:hypothetical protein
VPVAARYAVCGGSRRRSMRRVLHQPQPPTATTGATYSADIYQCIKQARTIQATNYQAHNQRGELSAGHGKALLTAKDLQARSRLARETVERGWTVVVLDKHVRASNMAFESQQDVGGEGLDSAHAQARQATAMNVARVWGDALGAEVQVRTMPGQKLRLEILFDNPEGAFALGGKISDAIARGTKRK